LLVPSGTPIADATCPDLVAATTWTEDQLSMDGLLPGVLDG
jgi:hypothetical protein